MEYRKFSTFIESTQYGYTAESTSSENGDAKYLRITDIVPYFVDKDRVPFCSIDEKKKAQYLVKKDDLLIARTGATTGYNLIVPEGFCNFIFASYLVRYNYDKKKLHPLYLKHVLKSNQYYGFVNNFIGGSAQPGMNPKAFGRFEVPYVGMEIQTRIADILEQYDALIELNNKRIELLEQMAENLYKEWFVRFRFPGYETAEFENGIPKGWEIHKIKEVVKRLPFGELYKSGDVSKEGKVIVIDQSTDAYVGFHDNQPSHLASIENPIAIFGDHSCKFQLMTVPFSLSENVIPYIGEEGVLTTYLYYSVCGIVETTEYKRHWSEFAAKKILVAPSHLQKSFVNIVQENLRLKENIVEQNYNLIKQRDLLLPRLMGGKLEV